MLGTLENARIAESLSAGGKKPKGWSYLGEGSFRITFRGPDGLVYKRDRFPEDIQRSEGWGNRAEWVAFTEWVERGKTSPVVEMADCWLHENGIMCAEFVEPDTGNFPAIPLWEAVEELVGDAYIWPSDFNPGNYRIRGGKYVVIDYGHWSSGPDINWWEWEKRDRENNPHLWVHTVTKMPCWCEGKKFNNCCDGFWEHERWERK